MKIMHEDNNKCKSRTEAFTQSKILKYQILKYSRQSSLCNIQYVASDLNAAECPKKKCR